MRPNCTIVLDDYWIADKKYDLGKTGLVKTWVDRMVAEGVLTPEELIEGTWFGYAKEPLRLANFRKGQGFAWEAPALSPMNYKIRVFEDGRELGPSDTKHNHIRRSGGGAYSHWQGAHYPYLIFSTSDNTDPNHNGRLYEFRVDSITRQVDVKQ